MIAIGWALDPGIRRRAKENQDAVVIHPTDSDAADAADAGAPEIGRPVMLVVADGMGGYEGGAVASSHVVRSFSGVYHQMLVGANPLAALEQGVADAHASMRQSAVQEPRLMQMGSTVAAVILQGPKIYLLNVGDSRVYLINAGAVRQISFDHSYVGEAVRRGFLSEMDARSAPNRNVLTMAISAQREQVEPFSGVYDWQQGDRLLICSDGLWGSVSEEQIQQAVMTLPPQEAANELVRLANANEGPDNIAVIIAQYMA